jgi:hypothetical protein
MPPKEIGGSSVLGVFPSHFALSGVGGFRFIGMEFPYGTLGGSEGLH